MIAFSHPLARGLQGLSDQSLEEAQVSDKPIENKATYDLSSLFPSKVALTPEHVLW